MQMTLMTMAMVLAVAGCATTGQTVDGGSGTTPDPDGVACRNSADAGAVRIDVEYHGDGVGTPSETCEVDPGTTITWRAPVGSSRQFRLQFRGASPAGGDTALAGSSHAVDSGDPLVFSSHDVGGRQKVEIVADNASGTYVYAIMTDTGIVDPAIIIR